MKTINKFLIVNIICILLIGCHSPENRIINNKKYQQGHELLQRVNNNASLTRIALKAVDLNIRTEAVKKINDDSLLVKIALESDKEPVFIEAIKNIKEESFLKRICIDTNCAKAKISFQYMCNQSILADFIKEYHPCIESTDFIEKISDPVTLAGLFFTYDQENIQLMILYKLKQPPYFDKLSLEANDTAARAIYKILLAFDRIPEEHYDRIVGDLLFAFCFFNEPGIIKKFGEIVSIKINRWEHHGIYTGMSSYWSVTAEGIKCSIKLKNLEKEITKTWMASLNEHESVKFFKEALIIPEELTDPVTRLCSQTLLAEIYSNSRNYEVRRYLLENIEDIQLLTKILDNNVDRFAKSSIEDRIRRLQASKE
jgi:hypothetical protein